MVRITKKRFLEIFAPGTKWRITKAWARLPGQHPVSYFQRTVKSARNHKCVCVRECDGRESILDLKQYPRSEYWYDPTTGAMEIRNPNEGRDKATLPFLILRYEPDDFSNMGLTPLQSGIF